jgi:hypothetical protein
MTKEACYTFYYDKGYSIYIEEGTSDMEDGYCSKNFPVGTEVYLAVVEYTTGNTFGRDSEQYFDLYIGETLEEAKDILIYLKDKSNRPNDTKEDKAFYDKYHYPRSIGYFEQIEDVYIKLVTVEDFNNKQKKLFTRRDLGL